MGPAAEMRLLLEAGDVEGLRAFHAKHSPHLDQPASHEAAEVAMHMARTQSRSVRFKLRAYSHSWLTERSLPSQLPDHLRPRAERMYPRIVEAVGVSVSASSVEMKPVARFIQQAMCDVVEDMYANGDKDPDLVRKRMREARGMIIDRIFG
jgi:hypothetical protein